MNLNADFASRYGPWAVVTGASSGIGRDVARLLGESGLNVVLTARNMEALSSVGEEITALGRECKAVPLDLSEPGAPSVLLRETKNLEVGLFVHAAGFGSTGTFVERPLAEEIAMVDVNCRAAVELSHGFGGRFGARGYGGIILFSSILAFQGSPRCAVYSATKAFIQTFGESIARELKPLGVDVLISTPGPTRTGFAQRAGMRFGSAAEPIAVARRTLEALGQQTMILPAWNARLVYSVMMATPRFLRIRIMERVMRSMTASA